MNYLSLMDSENEDGAAALRQLLGLYANLAETPVARQVEGTPLRAGAGSPPRA